MFKMKRIVVFVNIFSLISACCWDAHTYWNSRYAANGIDYTKDDTVNGMWSDNPYGDYYILNIKNAPSYSKVCSGCDCGILQNNGILKGCDGIVTIVLYSFPEITSITFAVSTTSITIQSCPPFNISEDTFTKLTSLTSLTIQDCGITSMPYVDFSPLIVLNLIKNDINIVSTYKGKLPATLKYLALTHNQLHWIPDGFLHGDKLRLVSLGYNNLTHFPLNGFGHLPNITYLGLEGNLMQKISVRHLKVLTYDTFVHLNLSTNMIDFIEPGAFRQLPNLKIIELHTNNLSFLPRGTFENISELVHLDLHGNKFEVFNTEALIDLEKLIELRLHSQTPDMMSILFNSMINIGKSLKYLFVSDNALTHIPHHVFIEGNFPELIELYADHNGITNITDLDEKGYGVTLRSTFLEKQKKLVPFGNTTNIQTLFLHNNLIVQINYSDLCELQRLQNLHLQYNRLNENRIQENGFKCLSSMIYLDLSGNYNMQYIPTALTTQTKLPSIQTLQLTNNKITFLEAGTFSNVSTLISLNLQNNLIVAIENNTFPLQLQILNLNSNSFRFIHEHQFSYLSNMVDLNLGNNEISYLPDEVFVNCLKLENLQLNSNKITQLKKVHFANCPLTRTVTFNTNHIGWIEGGTFAHIYSMIYLDLSGNRLYTLPNNGDFNNFTIGTLSLSNNRISAIHTGTFKDISVSYLYLQNNRISSILPKAFQNVRGVNEILLTGNQLRDVHSNAFLNVTCTTFSINDMFVGTIPSFAFNRFTAYNFNAQNTKISKIEQYAFNNIKVTNAFFLQLNRLTALDTSVFGGTSEVFQLYLSNNGMTTIASNAFKNLSVSYIFLNNNLLNVYPVALNQLKPLEIHLYGNTLRQIPTGSLSGQTKLQKFSVYDNAITEISSDIFKDAISLVQIDMHNNQIQKVGEGAFAGLKSLQIIDLSRNSIPYFPAIALPELRILNLADNLIETLGGIAAPNKIISLNLNNNPLGCECSTTGSLFNAINAISSETRCSSPNGLAGVWFSSSKRSNSLYYQNVDRALFQCSASNIVGTAISSTNIKVQWTKPAKLFDILGEDIVSTVRASNGYTVETWDYVVTCTSTTTSTLEKIVRVTVGLPRYCLSSLYYGAPCADECLFLDGSIHLVTCNNLCTPVPIDPRPITANDCTADCLLTNGIVSNVGCVRSCLRSSTDLTNCTIVSNHIAEVTFTNTDGVKPSTTYECVLKLRVDGYLSAKSTPVFVVTPATPSPGGGSTIGATDVLINVTYYDFSVGNNDFSSSSSLLPHSPTHVISPLGSWLAISNNPTADTFSEWFRSTSSNFAKQDQLLLKVNSTASSATVHQFWSDSFYPVDGFGFGTEGQSDCSGRLHNFIFTSAIRNALKYRGTEKITIGGGEELWLFINKQLVIQIVDDRSSLRSTACQMVNLSPAKESGTIIPLVGIIVNGECVGMTQRLSSAVNLRLEVGETYLFEIYHVERMTCSSELLIRLEDVYLAINSADVPPFHYKFFVKEDYHINGVVGMFPVWDVFQVGPTFQVDLVQGNEARHFSLKDDTNMNRNLGTTISPPTYTYTDLYGTNISFVECYKGSILTPEPNIPGTEIFAVTTTNLLLTIKSDLDYEVATDYVLVMTVKDFGTNLVGTLIIKVVILDVNDNCPLLSITEDIYLTPQPLLQILPLLTVNASDLDSGNNNVFSFYVSLVHTEAPVIEYNKSLDLRREIYNGTTSLTVTLAVIDEGYPPRGSAINIIVNISNSCLLNEQFEKTNYTFSVTNTTGKFYLRIPGYWIVDFQCAHDVGISSGIVRDELITASSFRNYLSLPSRGRLHLNASEPEYGPLTGGWVASSSDPDPYIVVNMELPYKFTKIHLQGQHDEPNWVETFKVFYSDDKLKWTLYQDNNGEFIFLGNNDQNTTKTLTLSPPILAQYIKINPRSWKGSAALRMELSGCSQEEQFHYDTSCERCYTSFYCLGDGKTRTCGRCENKTAVCDVTEHSFGAASECSSCPKGWICKDGFATPCPKNHYVECNSTFCPDACSPCDPGYACRGGQRYICEPGTFSDGTSEFCTLCNHGTYQDLEGQTSCKPCPAGYYSSTSKNTCSPCKAGTYSVGDGLDACIGCSSDAECPCQVENTCFSQDLCVNTGSGSFKCLGCPVGLTGDGVACADIDECILYKPCWNNSACLNTAPGYQCLACPRGYSSGTFEDGLSINNTVRVYELKNEILSPTQDQKCFDVDECLIDNGGCDPKAPCVNTIGSFYCGYCQEGYSGIPSVVCYSTNYCQTGQHKCASVAKCIYLGPIEYDCECPVGYAGNGRHCGLDRDLDGHPDVSLSCSDWGCKRDNCLTVPNCGQEDFDNDNTGDDCDDDKDNDGKIDIIDNCPYVKSFNQTDTDGDGVGDFCDNCPSNVNTDQLDTDKDGVGNNCDNDDDNDGRSDINDNCQLVPNPGQENIDGDKFGDKCDNCRNSSNNNQTDTDENGVGDACNPVGASNQDMDGDSVLDIYDNCLKVANGDQSDIDSDNIGDACDSDLDGDGVDNSMDNCPYLSNSLQTDINGDHKGDNCVMDSDGDGIDDSNDTCPHIRDISSTSFLDHFVADLYPGYGNTVAKWWVKAAGREIYKLADINSPSMLIGSQVYGSVSYTGTLFIRSTKGENYIGIVFGYVNNRKFYLVSWRTTNYNFDAATFKAGIKGLQIKIVDSNTGPGMYMAHALWHSSSTANQVQVLWHDSEMLRWSNFTSYKWFLTHNTDLGRIRFQLYDAKSMLVDSGDIYNANITGGRVGVYQFGQRLSLWSDIKVKCLDRQNMALKFDGIDNYVSLTNMSQLSVNKSFTFEVWIKTDSGNPITTMPVFCTYSRTVCVWIEGTDLYGQYGNYIVNCTKTVRANEWTSVVLQYDESEYILKLYVDGNLTASLAEIRPLDWNMYTSTSDTFLYLGKDANNTFKGYMDEVRFYNVAIVNTEIADNIKSASINYYPKYHQYGQLHYKMNQESGSHNLMNDGLLTLSAEIHGNSTFVESDQDFARFHLTYPTN